MHMLNWFVIIGALFAGGLWIWSFTRRFARAAATAALKPRYVRIGGDPSESVYKVVGPAPIAGFLVVETTDPDGGPLVNVAEEFVIDAAGFSLETARAARVAERAARAGASAATAPALPITRQDLDEEHEREDEPPPLRVPTADGYVKLPVRISAAAASKKTGSEGGV